AKPMGVYVTTFGTGAADDEKIEKAIASLFDFRPRAIVETLNLLRPIYRPTAAYGHFGRTGPGFTWERTDRAEELAALVLGKKASGGKGTNGAPKTKASNGSSKGKAVRGKRGSHKASGASTSA